MIIPTELVFKLFKLYKLLYLTNYIQTVLVIIEVVLYIIQYFILAGLLVHKQFSWQHHLYRGAHAQCPPEMKEKPKPKLDVCGQFANDHR